MELYKRFTLSISENEISETGKQSIMVTIWTQLLEEPEWASLNLVRAGRLPNPPSDWQWLWVVRSGDYRGTFPKRLAKYYFKEHGIKCPDAFLQEIGNIARRHSKGASFSFEFVDEFDWYDGDFGDSGSCYWWAGAGGRLMLKENDGRAVCFYDDQDNGIGRAWLAEIERHLYVLWNGYGFEGDPTLTIARVVSGHFGLEYKRIYLTNYGSTGGQLYINNGTGYAIGTADKLINLTHYDFHWTSIHIDICPHCGDEIQEDYGYYGADDQMYCENCYDNLFYRCNECGEIFWQNDMTYVDGDDYCDSCLNRNYVRCADCDEYTARENVLTINDQSYCEDCRPSQDVQNE